MHPPPIHHESKLPELCSNDSEGEKRGVELKLRTSVSFADEQSPTHTGCTAVEDDAVLGAPWPGGRVTPDGFDGAACCPMPGSLLDLTRFAPCGPYVPFLCHVANADFGTKDESFKQGEE